MNKDCFLISNVAINGLWYNYNLQTNINKDVNLFIGTNGSGKTTLLNIVNFVLSVDLDALNEIDFISVKIVLKNYIDKKTKTIKLEKLARYKYVYWLGKAKYPVDYSVFAQRPASRSLRRQNLDEFKKKIVESLKIRPIKTISVYRSNDKEILNGYSGESYRYSRYSEDDEHNPIDSRIKRLLVKFAEYREVLNDASNKVSEDFKMNVLRALLNGPARKDSDVLNLNYNEDDLNNTLKNLGLNKQDDLSLANTFVNSYENFKRKISEHNGIAINEIMQMPAYSVLDTAIELSKESDQKKLEINTPVNNFIDITNKFLSDGNLNKKISIFAGRLKIENEKQEDIEITKLSSGEKQLLILLLETLLQKNEPQIYIIDEPELSLHISWQREIIKSILQLNSNAQLIIATHSPEIVAYYRNKITNMENIIK